MKLEHLEDLPNGEAAMILSGAEPDTRYDVAIFYEGHDEQAAKEHADLLAAYEKADPGTRADHPYVRHKASLLARMKAQHYQIGTDLHGVCRFSYQILYDGDVSYKVTKVDLVEHGSDLRPVPFKRAKPHAHKLAP